MAVAGRDGGGESGKGRTDEASLGPGTACGPHGCQLLARSGPPRRDAFTSGQPLQNATRWWLAHQEVILSAWSQKSKAKVWRGLVPPGP